MDYFAFCILYLGSTPSYKSEVSTFTHHCGFKSCIVLVFFRGAEYPGNVLPLDTLSVSKLCFLEDGMTVYIKVAYEENNPNGELYLGDEKAHFGGFRIEKAFW